MSVEKKTVEQKIEILLGLAQKAFKSDKWKVIKNYREFGYDTWWLIYDDKDGETMFGYINSETVFKLRSEKEILDKIRLQLALKQIIRVKCELLDK